MNIVLIGSGNVATVVGRLIQTKGHKVIQVTSRNIEHAKILADELGTSYTDFTGMINRAADIYIIAVSDSVIHECVQYYNLTDKLIMHTAGSVSKDVLNKCSHNYGVLYPLQSLRKEMKEIPNIPFLVDGNSDGVVSAIYAFATTLSHEVKVVHDEERLKLHTAAVIVSNFTNYLYAVAEEFCIKEKVNFDLLKPLIMETASRLDHLSPKDAQTGPAIRKDILTLDKHLRVLANHQKLRTTYLRLTDSIMNP